MAVYLVCYIISFILARQHFLYAVWAGFNYSSLVAVYKGLQGDGQPDSPAGAFPALFLWAGREYPALKLSRLQTDWDLRTWVCLGLAVLTFWIVFEVLHRIYDGWSAADMQSVYRFLRLG